MIEHLATLVKTFPGTTNQMRCFAHVLNLVAKSVLRQFEAPKANGNKAMGEAAKELAAVSDELGDDANEIFESGGNEVGDDMEDASDEVANDDVVDDDKDGLPDERGKLSNVELTNLDKSVKPIRLVLTKVRQFKLLFR